MQTLGTQTGSRRRSSRRESSKVNNNQNNALSTSITSTTSLRSSSSFASSQSPLSSRRLLHLREEPPLHRSVSLGGLGRNSEIDENGLNQSSHVSSSSIMGISPACRTSSNLSGSFLSLPSASSSTTSIPSILPEQEAYHSQQKKRRRRSTWKSWRLIGGGGRQRRRSSSLHGTENIIRCMLLLIAVLAGLTCIGIVIRFPLMQTTQLDGKAIGGSIRRSSNAEIKNPKQNDKQDSKISEKVENGMENNEEKSKSELNLESPDTNSEQESDLTPESENKKITFQAKTKSAPSCSIPLQPSDINFTLVTQLSFNRLWMFPYHCSRIPPDTAVSMAVFTDKSSEEIMSTIEKSDLCSPDIRNFLTIQTLPTQSYGKGEYPVNKLRNMALSAVQTSHVMYIDIDFWESTNLFPTLTLPSVTTELAKDAKLALIIPAFQIKRQCREYRECPEENIPKMPSTRMELYELAKINHIKMFDPTNFGGHGSTLYKEWATQQGLGDLLDLPCIQSNRYEPYMAFRYCEDLPPFQEEFTGYGKNKMTWVMQMRRTGYRFVQLGGPFVVHYPHLDSVSRMEWNKAPMEVSKKHHKPKNVHDVDWNDYKRGINDAIFVQFRKWMNEEVEDVSRVFLCENAQNDDAKLWVDRDESE